MFFVCAVITVFNSLTTARSSCFYASPLTKVVESTETSTFLNSFYLASSNSLLIMLTPGYKAQLFSNVW